MAVTTSLYGRVLTSLVVTASLGVASLWTPPASAHPTAADGRAADCDVGGTVVSDVMGQENWAPVTPAKWAFPGTEVILAEVGQQRPGPLRPAEYAVLTAGPEFSSFQIDGEIRIDWPATDTNRAVIVVFGYRSDTEFYYAHLGHDNTAYGHNGIFLVNNADRLRIDDQWDGSTGAPSSITDEDYHWFRVRYCAETGEIAVFVDNTKTPLMTATDTTLDSGRVGFGSFGNIGRLRNVTVTGTDTSDACPNGDDRSTVWLGDVDSDVTNYDRGNGCRINDLILDDDQWDGHAAFMEHVTEVAHGLRRSGVITGRESGAIIAAGGRSDVGRPAMNPKRAMGR